MGDWNAEMIPTASSIPPSQYLVMLGPFVRSSVRAVDVSGRLKWSLPLCEACHAKASLHRGLESNAALTPRPSPRAG